MPLKPEYWESKRDLALENKIIDVTLDIDLVGTVLFGIEDAFSEREQENLVLMFKNFLYHNPGAYRTFIEEYWDARSWESIKSVKKTKRRTK